MSSEKAYATSY